MLFDLQTRVANCFNIKGDIALIRNIGNGYINKTYRVECRDGETKYKYTLQKINTNVFTDVDVLMDNYVKISEHLKEKQAKDPSSPHTHVGEIVKTRDGKNYYFDNSGCWRMYVYFSHAYSMDVAESPEIFCKAGTSFGRFIMDMSDYPVENIGYTIKNFHNTYSRYLDLEKAIEKDVEDRVSEVGEEIDFIRKRIGSFSTISDALNSGKIPTRITHNDTNLNNILFDKDTKEVVGIIDLDTTMPSSLLYDFGDSIRIGSNTACDDERDLTRVKCDLSYFKAYAEGFLREVSPIITKEETELLPYVAEIITMEDGIRFLADYINGDIYYTISRAKHNLDRARCQFALAADMEKKQDEIKALISDVMEKVK